MLFKKKNNTILCRDCVYYTLFYLQLFQDIL